MRTSYLVSYDVCDKKRLRLVHTKMRGYGDAVQYSVFLCDLSAQERALLVEALSEVIHHDEDQVMIVDVGPSDGRAEGAIEVLGKARPAMEHKAVVI